MNHLMDSWFHLVFDGSRWVVLSEIVHFIGTHNYYLYIYKNGKLT